jgi:phenylalanyl-tRNA synthetase alpha subunit
VRIRPIRVIRVPMVSKNPTQSTVIKNPKMMDIFEQVNAVIAEMEAAAPDSKAALEQFRIRYLGTKNIIKPLFAEIGKVPVERKKAFGQLVNAAKIAAETKFATLQAALETASEVETTRIDLTACGQSASCEHRDESDCGYFSAHRLYGGGRTRN